MTPLHHISIHQLIDGMGADEVSGQAVRRSGGSEAGGGGAANYQFG